MKNISEMTIKEIEDEIKNGINYIEVSNYMDAYKILFGND